MAYELTMKLDRLRNAIAQSVLCALLTMTITAPLGVAVIATLPSPGEHASAERLQSYREWKRTMRFPVAIVSLGMIPAILAAARFASTYATHPLPFGLCAFITASVAGIAHMSTTPLKGEANYTVTFVAIAVAALILTLFGTWAAGDEVADDMNANHAMDRSRGLRV